MIRFLGKFAWEFSDVLPRTVYRYTSAMLFYRFAAIVALALLIGTQSYVCQAKVVRVPTYQFLSFNIRNGKAADGADAWEFRREHVATLIKDSAADVIGLQECFEFQRTELLGLLPEYAAFGIGRDKAGGDEQCCVLYRRDRLQLLSGGTFWLSKVPDVPGSKSWDSSLPRICTWVRLYDHQTNTRFYLYNCHFDHIGERARLESAKLVCDQATQRNYDDPLVLMGDFNCGEDSAPVLQFKEHYNDAFRAAHPEVLPAGTFNGFHDKRDGAKIDYILVDENTSVWDAGINYDTYGEGRNVSDHYPVWAEVVFL